MRFGDILKQERTKRKMTQKGLARVIGLSTITRGSFIGMIEKGERFPSNKFLSKLCSILKLNQESIEGLIREEKRLLLKPGRNTTQKILKQYGLPLSVEIKLYQLFDKFLAVQRKEIDIDLVTKKFLGEFTEEILSNFAKIHDEIKEPLFNELCDYAKLDPKEYKLDNPTDRAIFLFDFFIRLDGILFGLIFGTEALIRYYGEKQEDLEYWQGCHLVPNYHPNIELILKGAKFLTGLRSRFIELSREEKAEVKKPLIRKLRL